MALAALKTWVKEKLTFDDLNAEFSHIRNNALSLISPLTSALDFDGKELILDADADTSITADTDDQIDFRLAGADDFQMTANTFTCQSGSTIVSAAISGTPVQHGLYRENVPKGWVKVDTAGSVQNSFNVSSVGDTGTGILTVTWDRNFADIHYVINVTGQVNSGNARIGGVQGDTPPAVGSAILEIHNESATLADPTFWHVSAMGDQ